MKKKEYRVNVGVFRSYNLTVEAKNETEAYDLVDKMQTTEIAEKGSLQDVEVEYIDVAGEV